MPQPTPPARVIKWRRRDGTVREVRAPRGYLTEPLPPELVTLALHALNISIGSMIAAVQLPEGEQKDTLLAQAMDAAGGSLTQIFAGPAGITRPGK